MVKQYEALGQYVIALQNTYENIEEMLKFVPESEILGNFLSINSVTGERLVEPRDFVIKDNDGNFHVMSEPTFDKFFGLWRTLPILTSSQEAEYLREITEEISRSKISLVRVDGEIMKVVMYRKKRLDFSADLTDERVKTAAADRIFNEWKGQIL